jgi:hypothetical protein
MTRMNADLLRPHGFGTDQGLKAPRRTNPCSALNPCGLVLPMSLAFVAAFAAAPGAFAQSAETQEVI